MSQFFLMLVRDKVDSGKVSLTRSLALLFSAILAIYLVVSLYIMISTDTVDHFTIGELITFILVLLGYKNINTNRTYTQADGSSKTTETKGDVIE